MAVKNITTPNACDSIAGGILVVGLTAPQCTPDSVVYTPSADLLGAPYPNPVQENASVYYSTGGSACVTLVLCDVMGRMVKPIAVDPACKSGNNAAQFSVNGLPDGVYFLMLRDGANVITRAVCVMR